MVITGNLLAKVVDYATKRYPAESAENHIAQQSYIDGFRAGYDLQSREWLEYAHMIQADGKWIRWHQIVLISLISILIGKYL